jgi:predicted nucleic acid-binding protein
MTLIVDAGALYAQANRRDPEHEAVANVLRSETGLLVTSELAVAEADYLILTRLGLEVELAFLRDLAEGTFAPVCLNREELGVALGVARRYRALRLGLADCSLVVLAQRYRTLRLATLNRRDFRAVTPLQGGAFVLLPEDG